MDKYNTNKRIRLAKKEPVTKMQILVIIFVVVGCIMMLYGNQKLERYRNMKSLDELTFEQLHENMYVKGTVNTTLCCYANIDLYDYYVIPIGDNEEKQQYITVLANVYHSVALGELPTTDYVMEEVGITNKNYLGNGYEIFGIVKKLPKDSLNYDYLKTQFHTEDNKKINNVIASEYCIKFANENNIKYWSECGLSVLICGIIMYLFFVIPARKKRKSGNNDEEYKNPVIREQTKQKVTSSIQHFIGTARDEITLIMTEYSGTIAQITSKDEIDIILNCFIHATYDKVYEKEVNRENLYTIEFILNNGESIECSMNLENIIFWYGNLYRIDHVSYGKIKKILNKNAL